MPGVVLINARLKCGNVREVKITPLLDALVATVEFQERVYPFFLVVFGCLIIRSIGQCPGSINQRQEADQWTRNCGAFGLEINPLCHQFSRVGRRSLSEGPFWKGEPGNRAPAHPCWFNKVWNNIWDPMAQQEIQSNSKILLCPVHFRVWQRELDGVLAHFSTTYTLYYCGYALTLPWSSCYSSHVTHCDCDVTICYTIVTLWQSHVILSRAPSCSCK